MDANTFMCAKRIALTGCTSLICSLGILSYGFYFKGPQKGYTELKTPIIDHKRIVIESVVKDRYIAEVIAKKKYPYTIAAIKKIESDTHGPNITGDGGDSQGMYQVQEKHWGKVPETVEGQTDQVADILEDLVKSQGYYEAPRAYNGSGKKARLYRNKVLTLVKEMEYLEQELKRKS